MYLKKIFLPLLIFFVFIGMFFASSIPDPTGYADADELAINSRLFSVAHPPGFALFTTIGHLTSGINANYISSLYAALALVFIFLALLNLIALPGAIIGTITLGFNYLFWLYATIFEVASFTALLTALLVWATSKWQQQDHNFSRWLIVVSIIYGSLVSHYLPAILLAPGLIFLNFKTGKPPQKHLILAIVISLASFLVINTLLLFQNQSNAVFSWHFPQTIEGWLKHSLIINYVNASGNSINNPADESFRWPNPLAPIFTPDFYTSLIIYFKDLAAHFTIIPLLLGIFGAIIAVRSKQALHRAFLLCWLFGGIYLAGFMRLSPDQFTPNLVLGVAQRQYMMGYVFFAMLISLGVDAYKKKFAKHPWAFYLLVITMIGSLFIANSSVLKYKANRSLSANLAKRILADAEPHALIICTTDIHCYSLMYQNRLLGIRSDVDVLPHTPFYDRSYLENHPDLYPFSANFDHNYLPQLIAWNLTKRPVYITEGIGEYIDYAGFETGPFYLIPAGLVLKFTTIYPESISASIQHNDFTNYLKFDPKDRYYHGILSVYGNAQAYAGYLALRYNHPEIASKYFSTAIKLDPSNQQTRLLLEHYQEILPSVIVDPNQTYSSPNIELELRKTWYQNPTDTKLVKKLIEHYQKQNNTKRQQDLETFLSYLQSLPASR